MFWNSYPWKCINGVRVLKFLTYYHTSFNLHPVIFFPLLCVNFAFTSLQLDVKEFKFVTQRCGRQGHKKLESAEGMFCWLLKFTQIPRTVVFLWFFILFGSAKTYFPTRSVISDVKELRQILIYKVSSTGNICFPLVEQIWLVL